MTLRHQQMRANTQGREHQAALQSEWDLGCCGSNRMDPADKPVHDWYRFVLSFPPHLVRHYLDRFEITAGKRVLDPFCGTGTTLVECMFSGAQAVGLEANPVAHFAASVKTDWSVRSE